MSFKVCAKGRIGSSRTLSVARRHTKVLKTTSNAARSQECGSQSHEVWKTSEPSSYGGRAGWCARKDAPLVVRSPAEELKCVQHGVVVEFLLPVGGRGTRLLPSDVSKRAKKVSAGTACSRWMTSPSAQKNLSPCLVVSRGPRSLLVGRGMLCPERQERSAARHLNRRTGRGDNTVFWHTRKRGVG